MDLLFNAAQFQAIPGLAFDDCSISDDDPGYITPPIRPQTDQAIAPMEPRRSSSLDFKTVFEPLVKMLIANELIEFSEYFDELYENMVGLNYELNLAIVNDGFVDPDIEELKTGLHDALTPVMQIIGNCVEGQDESTETCDDISITSEPVIETKTIGGGGLNQYECKGSTNKYWRYSYRVGGKLKHLHIRGGNERSPLVKTRVATLSAHIEAGWNSAAIATLIKSW